MPTLRLPGPGTWWQLDDVTLRADGMLLYESGHHAPTREAGRWRTDARGRLAIEAFTALDLEALGDAIDERRRRFTSRKRPVADTWDLPGGAELRDFVLTFGPVLAGFGATFPVRNAPAERAERDAAAARLALAAWRDTGRDPGDVRSRVRRRMWMVTYEGWAQGRHGSPPEVMAVPDGFGAEEPLFRLLRAQESVRDAVELADALALAEHWSPGTAARQRVRDRFFESGGTGPLALDGSTDWRRVVRGVPADVHTVVIGPDGARVAPGTGPQADTPMRVRPWTVDWLLAGRTLLADMIGRHVQWAQLYLGIDETGRIGSEWRTRSLEEVLYVQLMDRIRLVPRRRGYLERLPFWPIPRCENCSGAIIQHPRRPDGPRRNRWHAGCRKAGQMREARSGRARSASAD